MATYDGKVEWDSFFIPFERLAKRYQWSEEERLDKLFECLRGDAAKFLCTLPSHVRDDFTSCVRELNQRFGRKDPPSTIRRKLHELRQSKEQSADEFAEVVQKLVAQGYPTADRESQEEFAAEAFLMGYRNQKVGYEVLNTVPKTLHEAVEQVEAYQQIIVLP